MQKQESKTKTAAAQEAIDAVTDEAIQLGVAWSVLLNGDEPWKGCAIVPSRESMRNPA